MPAFQDAAAKIISGYHGVPWKEASRVDAAWDIRMFAVFVKVLVDAAVTG